MAAIGTVPTTTASDPASRGVLAQAPKPEEYTITELVLKMFEEKTTYVTKTLAYGLFWVGKALPDLPPQASAFGDAMGDFKNIVSAAEVPKKSIAVLGAFTTLKEAVVAEFSATDAIASRVMRVGKSARKAMEEVATLITSAVDGVDFGQRFLPIDATLMASFKGISSAATLIGSGSGVITEVTNLSTLDASKTKERTLSMIKLALNVSYAVVGILGLIAGLGLASVAPWMFVACLTSGLTFSCANFFYEKIYDPTNEGRNLNPNRVIENRMALRPAAGAA